MKGKINMEIAGGGIIGLLHLIFFVYAIIKILGSAASLPEKVIWGLVVFFFPCIGLIVWWLMGPK